MCPRPRLTTSPSPNPQQTPPSYASDNFSDDQATCLWCVNLPSQFLSQCHTCMHTHTHAWQHLLVTTTVILAGGGLEGLLFPSPGNTSPPAHSEAVWGRPHQLPDPPTPHCLGLPHTPPTQSHYLLPDSGEMYLHLCVPVATGGGPGQGLWRGVGGGWGWWGLCPHHLTTCACHLLPHPMPFCPNVCSSLPSDTGGPT